MDKKETVWLMLDNLSMLFDRDKSAVSRHIRNIFNENELSKDISVAKNAKNVICKRVMNYFDFIASFESNVSL